MKKGILIIIGIIMLLFGYYQFWFLRQPTRTIPFSQSHFVSPANGKISAVIQFDSSVIRIPKYQRTLEVMTSDVSSKGWMISIEMDVTNVHYQRLPLTATHIESRYVEGQFKNALIQNNNFGIRLENEHNQMLFETADGMRYKIIQVAGLVARRIVDYTEKGKQYQQGDVIGLIKLGSQVSIILPHDVEPRVSVGEMVTDGESILALLK
ncbi:MAG: phosphatidylserine decarboxylase [Bacteroidia bacterium]|nr:phosphatidylserine decarboxylase [Bacteroidia bacterium]